MDSVQLNALRTACFSDSSAAALIAGGDANGLHTYLNVVTAVVVWKTSVTEAEILKNGMDWTRVDNLGVGPSRIWEWMFKFGSIDPSKANIRAGIEAVWKGTAADLAVRAAVFGHCRRVARRAENMLATFSGASPGTESNPKVLTFEGEVSSLDAVLLVFRDDGTIWTP
jgi:hypothetical protein